MKWREYWCPTCKKMTAYAAGGILGSDTGFMACDVCGTKWEEKTVQCIDEGVK